ncbi:MAG: hypothetical protein IIB37_11150 [Gemmatimonadetes bacterium]|nr:hypothetical protein [Gemmatimonadota bacterium]
MFSGEQFIQLDIGYGRSKGLGSVCAGGLILPGQSGCRSEQVQYSSGLFTFSLGAPLAVDLGSVWSLRLRPRVGLGFVLSEEVGLETGNQHAEFPFAGIAGLATDVTHRIGRDHTTAIGLFAGIDVVKPLGLGRCDDCRIVLRDAMPKYSLGLTVAWFP